MTSSINPAAFTSTGSVPIPEAFLVEVLPQISDVSEIHVSIAVFRLAHAGGGLQTPLAERTIMRDRSLRRALRVEGSPREPDTRITTGLDLATGRGTLLKFSTVAGKEARVWYYVNSAENQALVAQMARGVVPPPESLWHDGDVPRVEPERPNAFRLYEQNIGLLTPLIAGWILDALERYPAEWIEEAIAEAASYNKRNWRYISRILENWAAEGRGDVSGEARGHETHRRRDANALDPDQYKHGHHLDRRGRP